MGKDGKIVEYMGKDGMIVELAHPIETKMPDL